jgi:hypothetical protein
VSTTFPPRERGRHGWAALGAEPRCQTGRARWLVQRCRQYPTVHVVGVRARCSASGVHGVLCVPVVRLAGVGVDLR